MPNAQVAGEKAKAMAGRAWAEGARFAGSAAQGVKNLVSGNGRQNLRKTIVPGAAPRMQSCADYIVGKYRATGYDAQVVRMTDLIRETSDEEFKKNKIQTLAELTRIRQLCCDPSLLYADYAGSSAKREALMELVTEAMEGGHRMLIFSQFTTMLDLIMGDLDAAGISYCLITGSTPKEERTELVNRFNKGSTPVFLISLKAGGTGLNLTGADVVIHYDPWWNLAVQTQATDRAHRIGQTKVVSVFRLIAKGTIEEKIVELQESKKNLADEILGQEGGTLTRMSREELLELLS